MANDNKTFQISARLDASGLQELLDYQKKLQEEDRKASAQEKELAAAREKSTEQYLNVLRKLQDRIKNINDLSAKGLLTHREAVDSLVAAYTRLFNEANPNRFANLAAPGSAQKGPASPPYVPPTGAGQRNSLTGALLPASEEELEKARIALHERYRRRDEEELKRHLQRQAELFAQAAKRRFDTEQFTNQSTKSLLDLQKRLQAEEASYATSKNKILQLERQNALDIEKVNKELQEKISKINQDYADRLLNKGASSAKRTAAIASAEREIQNLKDRFRAEKSAQETALSSFSTFLKQREFLAQNSIARQKEIELNGLASIQVARLKAAEKEFAIQQRLERVKAGLQAKLAAGAITPENAIARSEDAYRRFSSAILRVNSDLLAQEKAAVSTSSELQKLFLRVFEFLGVYRLLSAVFNKVRDSLFAIPQLGIQFEATKAILVTTVGSLQGATQTIKAIDKEAERTGLSVKALRESFRVFSASTTLAGESLEDTWRMFTNINTVSTALHLTTDQTSHVFLALAQIFNKTRVQSEELVKQLGNLLPGAFAAFAKANEHLFKSPLELSQKLKAGVVSAHDTVLNFTEFMANRFAASFEVASTGFFAESNRLQNAFTHLGEAIYALSSGAMIDFVKSLTSVVDYIREGVTEGNGFTETLKLLSNAGFALVTFKILEASKALLTYTTATGTVIGASALLARSLTVLKSAFAFLSNPATIIVGLGLIAGKIGETYEESRKLIGEIEKRNLDFFKVLAQKQKNTSADPLKFYVDEDPAVKTAKEDLGELLRRKKELENSKILKFISADTRNEIKYLNADIQLTSQRLQEVKDIAAEAFEFKNIEAAREQLLNYRQALETIRIDTLRRSDNPEERDLAARLQKKKEYAQEAAAIETTLANLAQERIKAEKESDPIKRAEKIITISKQVREALQGQKEMYDNIDAATARSDRGASKRTSAFSKQIKEDIKNTQIYSAQVSLELGIVEAEYARHEVAIIKFYAAKKELIAQDVQNQIVALQEAAEKQRKAGNALQAEQYTRQATVLGIQQDQSLFNLDESAKQDLLSFENQLKEINAQVLELKGNFVEAAKIRFDVQNFEITKKLQTELNFAIETGSIKEKEKIQTYQKQLEFLQQLVPLKAQLSQIEQQNQLQEERYSLTVQQINAASEIGAINQLDAFEQLKIAGEERIAQLEQIALSTQAAFNALPIEAQKGFEGQQLQNKILQYQNAIQQVRVSTNGLANAIGQNLSNSFSTFISSVITGTESLKDAFKNMLKNILQQLINFLVQQAVQQFIQLLISSFGSGAGAAGGAGSLGGALPLSKGGIVDKGNVLPFSKGGIPSIGSKLAYFPMVKGGIGSLREKGPEAILPLGRTTRGELGVKTSGSPASAAPNITFITHITVDTKDPDKIADAVAEKQMRMLAKEEIARAQRPGNSLNKTTTFR